MGAHVTLKSHGGLFVRPTPLAPWLYEPEIHMPAKTPGFPIAIAIALAIASAPSCDNCRPGESECIGNNAHRCYGNDNVGHWERASCGARICKVVQGAALCLVTTDPDPVCTPLLSTEGSLACDGTMLVACVQGYRARNLGTCLTADHCQKSVAIVAPICVLTLDPDPLCRPEGEGACDGSKEIGCYAHYRTSERECGAGNCYKSPKESLFSNGRLSGCVQSTTPDPRCAGIQYAGCDGAGNCVTCIDGLLESSKACGCTIKK
jgi:hypothetical protein